MPYSENIFDVTDYRGKIVIFTRKKWKEKRSDHPELDKKLFIECLKLCIADPDEVWEDYEDGRHKRCYYRKYSEFSYVKAVVWVWSNPCLVISAYEINKIKERNYPELRRLR